MRRAIFALLIALAMPMGADITPWTRLTIGVADGRYCLLAGCTMTGAFTAANGTAAAPSIVFADGFGFFHASTTRLGLAFGTAEKISFFTNDIDIADDTATFRLGAAADLIFSRPAAATLQLGAVDSSSVAVAQTLRVQGTTTATTNRVSANTTFKLGAPGTGNTAAGQFILQTPTSQASGTTIHVFNTVLTAQDFGLANSPRQTLTTPSTAYIEPVGNTKFVATSDFTTASGTFVTITGLSWTMPANHAMNIPFTCELLYSQATAAAANQFGIQDVTIAPTNLMVKSTVWTSASVANNANVPALTTTTATSINTFTPSNFGVVWNATISGFIEQPSNAAESVINILVLTGNVSDSITIKRGSFCKVGF